jgi:hypothetical protein
MEFNEIGSIPGIADNANIDIVHGFDFPRVQ